MIPAETQDETHDGELLNIIVEAFKNWGRRQKGCKHEVFVLDRRRIMDTKSLNFQQVR